MTEKAPILFLDYDGVLHRGLARRHPDFGIVPARPEWPLFEFLPVLEEVLDPTPAVRIILSTSWVPQLSFDEAKSQLTAKLAERVIGSTFHPEMMDKDEWNYVPRGMQIFNFVQKHAIPNACWVAVDDNDQGFTRFRGNLVKTAESAGLSDPLVQSELRAKLKAIELEFPWR